MSKIIGIDLGTTNSAFAYMVAGKPEVITNSEGDRRSEPLRRRVIASSVNLLSVSALLTLRTLSMASSVLSAANMMTKKSRTIWTFCHTRLYARTKKLLP